MAYWRRLEQATGAVASHGLPDRPARHLHSGLQVQMASRKGHTARCRELSGAHHHCAPVVPA